MAVKQIAGSNSAPDGSQYVTLTDGAGNLINATGGSGGSTVSGDVASGAADSGNPVKIGGLVRASGSAGALTDGNRTDALFGSRGALEVQIMQSNSTNTNSFVSSPGDGATNAFTGLQTGSMGFLYNGTTWDRQRSLGGITQTATVGVSGTVLAPTNAAVAGIASTATSVAAGSLILKASAGNLYSVCVNAGASAGYLMVFDSATVPADGVVTPVFSIPVAANGFYTTDWAYPIRGSAGLTLVFSTTGPFTKTISATAFLSGQFL